MTAGVIAEAAGLFAVTNFDDIVILSLFFAQGAGQRGSARRVIAGQYLAFTAILAVAIAVTFGARFLPKEALPYLGLLPIALGVRDAWKAWKNRKLGDHGEQAESGQGGPAILKVATTTLPTAATTSASTYPSSPTSAPAARSCTAWSSWSWSASGAPQAGSSPPARSSPSPSAGGATSCCPWS